MLCGLEIDIRDNEAILERLAKVGQKPITAEAGRKLARQLNLVMYVECSALTQKGLKNVFDEAILAALEPPEPIAKKFEFRVPTTVKKIFKNFRRKRDKVAKEVGYQYSAVLSIGHTYKFDLHVYCSGLTNPPRNISYLVA